MLTSVGNNIYNWPSQAEANAPTVYECVFCRVAGFSPHSRVVEFIENSKSKSMVTYIESKKGYKGKMGAETSKRKVQINKNTETVKTSIRFDFKKWNLDIQSNERVELRVIKLEHAETGAGPQ